MLGRRRLVCSFCRRDETQVAKLVAGPRLCVMARVYICDRCVAEARAIMDRSTSDVPPPERRGIFRRVWTHLARLGRSESGYRRVTEFAR